MGSLARPRIVASRRDRQDYSSITPTLGRDWRRLVCRYVATARGARRRTGRSLPVQKRKVWPRSRKHRHFRSGNIQNRPVNSAPPPRGVRLVARAGAHGHHRWSGASAPAVVEPIWCHGTRLAWRGTSTRVIPEGDQTRAPVLAVWRTVVAPDERRSIIFLSTAKRRGLRHSSAAPTPDAAKSKALRLRLH